MPNDWELAHNLNPPTPRTGTPLADGYTQLEVYLNTLTGEIGDRCRIGWCGGRVGMFVLWQNYPNPFNPTTVIRYRVGAASDVRLTLFDQLGREVAALVSGRKAPGSYEVRFDASGLASGVYLCRLRAGDFVQTRKLLFLR